MATVIPLVSPQAVDGAWDAYVALAVRLVDQPHLIADRSYNEAMARAHEKWKRLYLLQERV